MRSFFVDRGLSVIRKSINFATLTIFKVSNESLKCHKGSDILEEKMSEITVIDAISCQIMKLEAVFLVETTIR